MIAYGLGLSQSANLAYNLASQSSIDGGGSSRAFISSWKTDNAGTSSSTQITVPTVSSGTYNCVVDWGDGTTSTITTYNDAAWTHTYSGAGTYTVRITGTFYGIWFANGGDKLKLLNISAWGTMRLGNASAYFWGCSNLTITAKDVLNLTGTTSLSRAFQTCSALTTIPSINSWNTAAVTDMYSCFYACSAFNQSLNNWNTAAVTNMNAMFGLATLFNGDITTWNTAAVTNMDSMFFNTAAFNQNIGSWNIGNVTNIQNMFRQASVFNQNIGSWDTSKVTNMYAVFYQATVFNQNIGSWNTANVVTMEAMFYNTNAFNQPIGGWNTSKVTNMQSMFQAAIAFNQSLSWNTSKVTNMVALFSSGSVFNQDISLFSIAALTNATSMFSGGALSTTNYNLLLDSVTGWPSQATIQSGVTFSAGTAHYSAGAPTTGRAILTGTKSWTITDGGTP